MMNLVYVYAVLSAAASADVESRSLRLVVETSADLVSYSVDAEFSFFVRSPSAEILFFFPDAETPTDFARIELDEIPFDRSRITVGVHPRFGGRVFMLRPDEAGMRPGAHRLRVRGNAVPTPERGLTRWGSWHPFLLGGDVPVPIELEVRTSRENTVVASGRHIAEDVQGGIRISRWISTRPQSWVFLAVGRYRTLANETAGPSLDVVWPEDAADIDPMRVLQAEPDRILDFYGHTFGTAESAHFRVIVFPETSIQRFSVDGLIGLSTAAYPTGDSGDYLRTVLAHELAHYWWGDLVQPSGVGRRWLTEGFAEYSRHLYEMEIGAAGLPWSYRNLVVLSRFVDGEPPPMLGGEPNDATPEIDYQKGTFVLGMLGAEIGQDALLRALRGLVSRAASATVTAADFRQIAEKEAGRELGWFFEQWLDRGSGPLLALEDVTVERTGGSYRVEGTIVQDEPVYRLSLPIAVRAEGGETRMDTLRTERQRTQFAVETEGRPEKVILDPGHRVFKWYRAEQLPVSLADAWRALEKASPRVVFGGDVAPESRSRLFAFLRERFHRLETGAAAGDGSVVLVGEPAAQLRRDRAPHLEAPPPGTVQAFVVRSQHDASHVLIGIEGEWPETWPEIIPQAPLSFVRFQGEAIVSAMSPSLLPISLTLPPAGAAVPGN